MKQKFYIIATALFSCLLQVSFAQTLNWKTLKPSQRHVLNLHAGIDNGSMVGIGYAYRLNTRMPLLVHLEYSQPFGTTVFDDFRTKLGGQLNIVHSKDFRATVKAAGLFRCYQNDLVRMLNFGSEFSTIAGIYKQNWFAAVETGFDKAIVTHIKHNNAMEAYNPNLESGWYIPTGGIFFYGLQGGFSLNKADVYAKLGRMLLQDFQTSPTLPLYFQTGVNLKW